MSKKYKLKFDVPGLHSDEPIVPLSALSYGFHSKRHDLHLEWPKDIVENSPDWFQEIKEPEPSKEWEIVKFQWNTFGEPFTYKCYNGVWQKQEDWGKFFLKHGYKIHSVKRLSDNQTFSIGDMVEVFAEDGKGFVDTINHFTYCAPIIDVYFKDNRSAFSISHWLKNAKKLPPSTQQEKEVFTWEEIESALSEFDGHVNDMDYALIKHDLKRYLKQSKQPSPTTMKDMRDWLKGTVPSHFTKEAIEDYVNKHTDTKERVEYSKDDIVGLLRDAVSETWGNPSLDETQILFDKFLYKRKLAPPSKAYINKFVTNKVNEILLDKKYTQEAMDNAEECAWNFAREQVVIDKNTMNKQYRFLSFRQYQYYKKQMKGLVNKNQEPNE